MARALIIGYGNPDREDDGVAWHIIRQLAGRLDYPASTLQDETCEWDGKGADLQLMLQLIPEMAETIANYEAVCFVDAHTGAYPENVRFEKIEAQMQSSPFTHHLTPHSCLSLAQAIYGRSPQAVSVSVRGFHFRFATALSEETSLYAGEAVNRIWDWLQNFM